MTAEAGLEPPADSPLSRLLARCEAHDVTGSLTGRRSLEGGREKHAAPAGSIFIQTGLEDTFIRNVSILSCVFLGFSPLLKKHSSGWAAKALLFIMTAGGAVAM